MKTLNPANPANNGARPATWMPTATETGAYSQAEVDALLTPVAIKITAANGSTVSDNYSYRVGNVAYFSVTIDAPSSSSNGWRTVGRFSLSDGKKGYTRFRCPDNSAYASGNAEKERDVIVDKNNAINVWLPSGSSADLLICCAIPLV